MKKKNLVLKKIRIKRPISITEVINNGVGTTVGTIKKKSHLTY